MSPLGPAGSAASGGRSTSPAVVAFGGGHGLAASLQALRHLTDQLTAIVTVADDGGSSGKLRAELGILPPGDLRMALSALCDDGDWGQTWRDVLQYRFASDGPLNDHALGNLLIAALWQQLGDAVAGLDLVARLLGARGRVLPMSSVPLRIEADVAVRSAQRTPEGLAGPGYAVQLVKGQAAVATAKGRVLAVRLEPADPPARPEAVAAIDRADWVVLGPGSWFTSVIPHLLVPDLRAALARTDARRALVLNLVAERGEARGMSAADHVRALADHSGGLRLDVVLADPSAVTDVEELSSASAAMGARLLLRQVRSGARRAEHDPLRLAAALRDVVDGAWGDVDDDA